jgi:hypothetical protein
VLVAIVHIGIVRMLVHERGVPMPAAVRLPSRVIRGVLVNRPRTCANTLGRTLPALAGDWRERVEALELG